MQRISDLLINIYRLSYKNYLFGLFHFEIYPQRVFVTTVLKCLIFGSPWHAKCKNKTNTKFNLFVEPGGFTSAEKKPANYFLKKVPNNCQKKMDSPTVEISLSYIK